jgi:lipoate-protein ligase A
MAPFDEVEHQRTTSRFGCGHQTCPHRPQPFAPGPASRAHNLCVRVERRTGSAGEFHAAPIPDRLPSAVAWVFELDRPALVLGSGQREEVADARATRAAGTEVVRRHSGGGAVLLNPRRCSWIDVLLPRHDPRWSDDVGTSAHWLGDTWASALRDLGVDAAVHRGALQKTTWGPLVCFGAVGPGEVIVGARKVVGISQRRTRIGARFQCLVLDRWDPAKCSTCSPWTPLTGPAPPATSGPPPPAPEYRSTCSKTPSSPTCSSDLPDPHA